MEEAVSRAPHSVADLRLFLLQSAQTLLDSILSRFLMVAVFWAARSAAGFGGRRDMVGLGYRGGSKESVTRFQRGGFLWEGKGTQDKGQRWAGLTRRVRLAAVACFCSDAG